MIGRALIAAAALAGATAAAAAPKQVALLICNADYDRNGHVDADAPPGAKFMPDLVGTCRDRAAIAQALAAYDFTVELASDADRTGLDATFRAFADKVQALPPGSTVFIYYAGHGAQFDSDVYGVPVLYQPGLAATATEFAAKRRFLVTNANRWSSLLAALPDRPDISVAVVIDACRNNPFVDASVYNESTVPRGGNNQAVFYATNGGNTTADAGGLARVIVGAFRRGGTINEIMQKIWLDDGLRVDRLAARGETEAEGEPWTGRAFAFSAKPVLRRAVPNRPPAPPPTPPSQRAPPGPSGDRAAELARIVAARPPHAPVLHAVTIGTGLKLDVFVCQGDQQLANLAFAERLADSLKTRGGMGIGLVRVRYLTDALNDTPGYRVRVNLMRYDVPDLKGRRTTPAIVANDAAEKRALIALARAYPEGSFLPQPGIGVNGQPTLSYISAFVCGRVVGDDQATPVPPVTP